MIGFVMKCEQAAMAATKQKNHEIGNDWTAWCTLRTLSDMELWRRQSFE